MNLLKRFGRSNEDRGDLSRGAAHGLSLFRREMDRAFDRVWREFERDPWAAGADELAPWPAMDVEEDDKAVTLRVDVPGLGPRDIEVEVAGDLLTVKGTRREHQRSEGNGGAARHERYVGSFTRTVPLPPYVDADKIEARYNKGVLIVTAPKIPGEGSRRVPVTLQEEEATTAGLKV